MLDDEVPLIGFAGSPWTIMCYAGKDKDLKVLIKAKGFCFSHPSSSCFIAKNH
jgi:uroporphyrinogen decarboxylase